MKSFLGIFFLEKWRIEFGRCFGFEVWIFGTEVSLPKKRKTRKLFLDI